MPNSRHSFATTTTIIILILLQCLHPTLSQSGSPLPAYNLTYPSNPDHSDDGIQVSYKDTIDVSWIANGSQNNPVLQIQCWARNDSSSYIYFQHLPTYSHNISTSSTASDADFPLPLSNYQKYSPCELQLLDPDTQGSESVTSIAIFISQYTNSSTQGVTWSLEHAAPKVAVDAGVATAETGSAGKGHNGAIGGGWAAVGAMVVAAMLL